LGVAKRGRREGRKGEKGDKVNRGWSNFIGMARGAGA